MFIPAASAAQDAPAAFGAQDAPAKQTDTPTGLAAQGTLDVESDLNGGRRLPFAPGAKRTLRRAVGRSQPLGAVSAQDVGETRMWMAMDTLVQPHVYFKDYTLRGIGANIEVWVAHDNDGVSTNIQFPTGDCRNGVRTTITDEQVDYLIGEYDNNILPDESRVFSTAPDRDGTNAVPGIPATYFRGEGDNVVVLVDNVRDDNFYDRNNSRNLPYIGGFFSPFFNELVDRNIMTIDAYDWLHRTTATPPHDPVPGNNCASAPARPFSYEETFAHEYQHLLHHYEDANEVSWVNEGLSMWVEKLTEYSRPALPVTEIGHSPHVQCFLGFVGRLTDANPNPRPGGPENSLTWWGDQAGEVVCDYGAAYTMMLLLEQRFGEDFMTRLHRSDGIGLAGLQSLLAAQGANAAGVLHDWAAMVALDHVLDAGATLHGGSAADYQVDALNARVNWHTPNAYSSPGAPPNGSDYVRLRGAAGRFLDAGSIERIIFDGAESLPGRVPGTRAGPVSGFTLRLVAYTRDRSEAWIAPVRLGAGSRAVLGRRQIAVAIGASAELVGAIVTYDEPTERVTQYAPYRLVVNGVRQPGG
jgi:hypothetical protein